jgi:hypothetical protein
VDDAARVTQSQFSPSSDDERLRFERAVALAATGADPVRVAELLLEGAEPSDLFDAPEWASLPPPVRVEASLQAAWLGAERDDEELSLDAATRALELEPADERALAIAEPLWLERESFTELAERYARAAAAVRSVERARQLLERAAHMLQDSPSATPALVGLHERLALLPRERGAEDASIARLKSPGAEASAALLELGERWLKDGRAREGAQAVPRDLSAFQGDAALDMLERLFAQAEDVHRLAEVLQRRVQAAPTPEARGRALDELAQLEHEKRGDLAAAAGAWLAAAQAFLEAGERDDAERTYERLLGVLPDHLNAAARLVELRASAGDFAGVTEAFGVLLRSDAAVRPAADLLLRIAADAGRACAAEELSELVDGVLWRLGPDERALADQLLRESARLFAAQDRDDDAAEVYRRLIADSAAAEDVSAFQTLIDEHPASDWRQLQQRWLFEWREQHDVDRATVLFEWARFEEEDIGDLAAAASVLTRAAELAPERADVWRELARLRLAGGDGEGGLVAAEHLRRLGHELEPTLLEAVLEHEPGARWAVDRLKVALSAEGRFPELLELYDRAIANAASAEERARWLDEAAVAARDVAQDRARAVLYWEAFVQLAPGDARVDLALERLYEQANDHVQLLAHLERRLAHSTPEQRVFVEQRVVRLALELGAVGSALDAVRRLKTLDAGVAGPLLEATFTRCAELGGADAAARACGRECAELLRAGYAERGEPEGVARVLRAELELELDFDERCAKLSELSRWCESELGDLHGAFEAACLAFVGTLAVAERERLETLAETPDDWATVVATYLNAADSELGADARRRLLRRAADISTERLEDADRATLCYEILFAVEPSSASDVFAELDASDPPAFEGLCRVLSRAGRHRQLADALESRARTTHDAALYSRLARVQAEALADPLSAIDSHLLAGDTRAAAELFLRQPSAFGEDTARALTLASRLVDVGLPEGAARVLRHQLAAFGEHFPPTRRAVQLALVRALEACGALDAAHELLSEAAKRYPTDAEVQRAGAAAAAARRDWERAEQCYRTLLLLLHGEDGRATQLKRTTVYVELAALKLQQGDERAAAELLESGFEAALDHVEELQALVGALLAHALWEPAERAATQLLERGDEALAATLSPFPTEEAEQLLTRTAKQFAPGEATPARRELARCLRTAADRRLERDELVEALPLLSEAHRLDEANLDTALLLGLLAIDLDRLELAAAALRALLAQGSREGAATSAVDFSQGYLQLARIEQHHGKKTNAEQLALRALKENPRLAPAKQLLDELSLL